MPGLSFYSKRSVLLLFVLSLSACGGGGSSDDNEDLVADDELVSEVADDGIVAAEESDSVIETDTTDEDDAVDNNIEIVGDSGSDNNAAPNIVSFLAAPTQVMVNDPVDFEWQATDIEDTVLSCSLDADQDGNTDFTSNDCSGVSSFQYLYPVPGDFTALLTVTDQDGAVTTSEFDIHVLPLMVSITSLDSVTAGSRILYNVRISNVSEIPINNVQASYRIPSGLSFRSDNDVQPDSRGCFLCNSDDESSWEFGTLEPGESRIIEVNANVDEIIDPNTLIESEYIVTGEGLLTSISISDDTTVVSNIEANITIESSVAQAMPGEIFDINVRIGNLAGENFTGSTLTLVIPPGVQFESTNDGGAFEQDTNTVRWSIANFPVLESQVRSVRISAEQSAVSGLILPFQASVSQNGDTETDASVGFSLPVSEAQRQLLMGFSYAQNPLQQDGRLLANITVSNVSLVPLRDVQLVMRLPSGLSFRSDDDATPNLSGCFLCSGGDESFWTITNLDSGESRTLSLNANLDAPLPAGALISFPATLTSPSVDQVQQRNFVARIDNNPIVETAVSDSVNAVTDSNANAFDLNIDVGNISNQNLSEGTLSLDVPDGLTLLSTVPEDGELNSATGTIIWSNIDSNVSSVDRYTATFTVNTDSQPGSLKHFNAKTDFPGTVQLDSESESTIVVTQNPSPLLLNTGESDSTALAGTRLAYQFVLVNEGLVPLNNVFLLFRVPDGLSFRSDDDAMPDGSGCFLCFAGDEIFWSFPSIGPGEQQQIFLNAEVSELVAAGSIIDAPVTSGADGLPFTLLRNISTPAQ